MVRTRREQLKASKVSLAILRRRRFFSFDNDSTLWFIQQWPVFLAIMESHDYEHYRNLTLMFFFEKLLEKGGEPDERWMEL